MPLLINPRLGGASARGEPGDLNRTGLPVASSAEDERPALLAVLPRPELPRLLFRCPFDKWCITPTQAPRGLSTALPPPLSELSSPEPRLLPSPALPLEVERELRNAERRAADSLCRPCARSRVFISCPARTFATAVTTSRTAVVSGAAALSMVVP